MRLKTIILINRAPFERIQIDFDDENVYLLSGINGVGKTTIISYIVDAFFELAKKAFPNEFEDKQHKYYRISSSLYSLDNSKSSIVYMRFKNDKVNRDYIDIRGNCTEREYDEQINLQGKIPFSMFEGNLKKRENVKYWSLVENKEIVDIFSNNIMTFFPAYRYESPSYLNDPYKIKLSFTKETPFTGYLDNPIEVTTDILQIVNWIMDVILDKTIYPEKTNDIIGVINDVITKILFSKIKEKTRIAIGQRNSGAARIAIAKQDADEQVYPTIFDMSSGELALLSLFGELIRQSDKNNKDISNIGGIVLVDEIEKHLHIQLQKEALPQLIKLFPNLQFIVSTHSPFFALGLQDENCKYALIDLGKKGLKCLPTQTELYKEVYEMMVEENNRFADKYKQLQISVEQSNRPIVLTEGKTDWKHIKAAMKRLDISDIEIEFYETEDTTGKDTLSNFLDRCAGIPQSKLIIGIFDHDDQSFMSKLNISENMFRKYSKNVYAFVIPLVNEEDYGYSISIEHYYKRNDLCKTDENGRRLFLGDEFYDSGNSKNGKYQTKISNIHNKVKLNGVIDEKVYESSDLEQTHSIAMSKSDFADKVINNDPFTKDFDFSSFSKIFDVIRKIIDDNFQNS